MKVCKNCGIFVFTSLYIHQLSFQATYYKSKGKVSNLNKFKDELGTFSHGQQTAVAGLYDCYCMNGTTSGQLSLPGWITSFSSQDQHLSPH